MLIAGMNSTLAIVFVFGLLVFVHEFGHFAAAKLVGMKVHEFAIGFGPKLFSFRRRETLYSLRLIPLGGFNKIAGMEEGEEQDEYSFGSKPLWARMLVIVAGSAMNFVLPVLIFSLLFTTAGIRVDQTVISSLMDGSPAARSGLAPGDHIVAVNNQPVQTWQQFVDMVQEHSDSALTIAYERNSSPAVVTVTPQFNPKLHRVIIGLVPQSEIQHPGVLGCITMACSHTYQTAGRMLEGLVQMVSQPSKADVSGPIGIAKIIGEQAQDGIMPVLSIAAMISINLGLINLLPIPVLDGGYIVSLLWEGLRGKAVNQAKWQLAQMAGMTLLLGLMIFATYKDISRTFLQMFH